MLLIRSVEVVFSLVILSKAGGDATAFQRALQKLLVRVPAQDPPPDDIEMSSAASKLLRAAQKIQKDKV
jgi:ATP-dependent Clp protease ATP-binding subunit ClpB